MITAIVLIETDPQAIAALAPTVAEIPGVAEAHSVAGGDANLVAIVRVADHEAVATTVTEHISQLAGIRNTHTMIAFRSFANSDLDAAYEGF